MSLHDPPCVDDHCRKQDKIDEYYVCPVVAYSTTEFVWLSYDEIDDEGDDKEQGGS